MGGMIMTPEEYIDQMKIQEVSWNGDICENEPTGITYYPKKTPWKQ